jgi:hypothetical protein
MIHRYLEKFWTRYAENEVIGKSGPVDVAGMTVARESKGMYDSIALLRSPGKLVVRRTLADYGQEPVVSYYTMDGDAELCDTCDGTKMRFVLVDGDDKYPVVYSGEVLRKFALISPEYAGSPFLQFHGEADGSLYLVVFGADKCPVHGKYCDFCDAQLAAKRRLIDRVYIRVCPDEL